MALVLSEEQQLLKDTAVGFFADKAPVSQLRELRDTGSERGYSDALWSEMAEMGFAGLLIDEDQGGTGFGYVGAGIVAEAMGTTLVASPYHASAVAGASALSIAGNDVQKGLLESVATGEALITLAVDESGQHNPSRCAFTASKTDTGYELSGLKTFVQDLHVADKIIIAARTSGQRDDASGITLFLVDSGTGGMIVDRTVMADSRNWGKLTCEKVQVSADNVLGDVDAGFAVLDQILDRARIVIAAELLGIAQDCLNRTTTYLQERKQFGVLIGTFQGLQHRAAHLYGEVEMVRSAVLKALQAADANDPALAAYASIAKAKASSVAELATNEAIQMHGGIGMTDEFDLGFYMKRARTLQNLYGGYNFHTDRFATLSGY